MWACRSSHTIISTSPINYQEWINNSGTRWFCSNSSLVSSTSGLEPTSSSSHLQDPHISALLILLAICLSFLCILFILTFSSLYLTFSLLGIRYLVWNSPNIRNMNFGHYSRDLELRDDRSGVELIHYPPNLIYLNLYLRNVGRLETTQLLGNLCLKRI